MSYLIASIILISILLVNLIFIVFFVKGIIRDWPVLSKAWRQMELFEKNLLYMGIFFFIFIPALKNHPAKDLYVAQIFTEILPALAGSFFVAGVMAFMRQLHEIRKKA